jgi:ketosteroid isomerase-like protein
VGAAQALVAVSAENVEILRRAFEAYNRGDLEGVVAEAAPDLEYTPSGALPGSTDPVQGPDGYLQFLRWLTDNFADSRVEVSEFRDAGDQVFAELALTGRGKQSGVETSWTVWHVWTVKGGKLVRGRAFTSKEEALDAAGLAG